MGAAGVLYGLLLLNVELRTVIIAYLALMIDECNLRTFCRFMASLRISFWSIPYRIAIKSRVLSCPFPFAIQTKSGEDDRFLNQTRSANSA